MSDQPEDLDAHLDEVYRANEAAFENLTIPAKQQKALDALTAKALQEGHQMPEVEPEESFGTLEVEPEPEIKQVFTAPPDEEDERPSEPTPEQVADFEAMQKNLRNDNA